MQAGNIHDEAGQSIYCQAFGTCVIGRVWYEVTSWALDKKGCCRSCGARCAGVFEQGLGATSGARRRPLKLGFEG